MDWEENCIIGDQGLTLAMPLIQQMGVPIIMSGNHPITLANQKLGVDVIVGSVLTSRPIYVEVKTEQHTSENIFIETVQNRMISSDGWYHTIESDIMIWVFLDFDHGYLIRINPLFEWVNEHSHILPIRCSTRATGYTPSWASVMSGLGPENIQAWDYLHTDGELQQKLKNMNLL